MSGDLNRYLNVSATVWSTVICIGVALVAGAVCYPRKGIKVAARMAGWLLLAGSIAVILVITFDRWHDTGGPFPSESNWVPFRDINDELHNVNRALGIINIAGNIALFIPSGILAGLLFRPRWAAFLVAPVLSIGIEITQQYVGLSADIDDIILNTLGGAIGVALALLAHRVRAGSSSTIAAENAPPGRTHEDSR